MIDSGLTFFLQSNHLLQLGQVALVQVLKVGVLRAQVGPVLEGLG